MMNLQMKRTHRLSPLFIAMGLLYMNTQALAQTPDAGSLLRDIEALQPDLEQAPEPGKQLPPPLPDTGETIQLSL